jgi:hypothetical protein
MRDTPDELYEAPELAALAILDATLDQAALAVLAQCPELADCDGLVGLPPITWVADHLVLAMRDLQRLLLRYREAALDDARYRARNPSLTPPPPRNFAE